MLTDFLKGNHLFKRIATVPWLWQTKKLLNLGPEKMGAGRWLRDAFMHALGANACGFWLWEGRVHGMTFVRRRQGARAKRLSFRAEGRAAPRGALIMDLVDFRGISECNE
jgi:hypothetical protein